MLTALPRYRLSWTTPHSHTWIDPTVPPIQRRMVSPIIGDRPTMMQPGRVYRCRDCGQELEIPVRFKDTLQ